MNIFDRMAGKEEKKLEELHPPKAPARLEVPPPMENIDDEFFIDLATSSEFKRFVYKMMSGKVHRGSSAKLNNDINTVVKRVKIASDVEKLARGSRMDYRDVMKELKEKLKSRKK